MMRSRRGLRGFEVYIIFGEVLETSSDGLDDGWNDKTGNLQDICPT